jgi:hypothetical protein
MPIQSIPLGPSTLILQNVVYALPAKLCTILSSAAIDGSTDGSTWSAITGANTVGASTAASFIRCTTGNTTVTCKSM